MRKRIILVLIGLLVSMSLVFGQDQNNRVNPVNPWSPLLVSAGSVMGLGGAFIISQSFNLKTVADEKYQDWLANKNDTTEKWKNTAQGNFYGALGLGLGLGITGLVLGFSGMNIGEMDNDYFLVPPPSPTENSSGPKVGLVLGLDFTGLVIR